MGKSVLNIEKLVRLYDNIIERFFLKKSVKSYTNGWANEKIEHFAKKLNTIGESFFNTCIETISSCSSYDIEVVNRSIGGKAKIVITVLQLIHISDLLSLYIEPAEEQDFNDLLMELTCRKHCRKCHDFIESYKQLEQSVSNKKIFFISVDIAKYLYGHSNNQVPSSFPCLTSYISNGLSTQIVDRLSITESALLIAPLIPKLTDETSKALADFFDAGESEGKIEAETDLKP